MKKIICIVLIFLSLPCTLYAEKWDIYDKALMAGVIIGNFIDLKQTQEVFDNPNYHELNPSLCDREKWVPAYFILQSLAVGYFADKLEGKNRKAFLGLFLMLKVDVINHNFKIGVGLPF